MINENEYEMSMAILELKENPSEEKALRLMRKYGSAYRLTDRGSKYYSDLIAKYVSGVKINDDKLLILLGLNVYGSELNDYAIGTDNEIIAEIKEKLGIDPNNNFVINELLIFMMKNRYLEDNPKFVELFNIMANERIKELELARQW